MLDRKYIFVGVALIVVVVAALFFMRGDSASVGENGNGSEREVEGEPLDVASEFYNMWLTEANAEGGDVYGAHLVDNTFLSDDFKDRLKDMYNAGEIGELDPVVCQTVTPSNVRIKPVFIDETEAQMLYVPRVEGSSTQALATLEVIDYQWRITDIECTNGEIAPDREYSFEKEGFLLKNVPEPLDANYWHLVFEQGGQMGHTVPLFFDGGSVCITTAGEEATCNPDQFTEASAVYVQAEMSEAGATVKRLRFEE